MVFSLQYNFYIIKALNISDYILCTLNIHMICAAKSTYKHKYYINYPNRRRRKGKLEKTRDQPRNRIIKRERGEGESDSDRERERELQEASGIHNLLDKSSIDRSEHSYVYYKMFV